MEARTLYPRVHCGCPLGRSRLLNSREQARLESQLRVVRLHPCSANGLMSNPHPIRRFRQFGQFLSCGKRQLGIGVVCLRHEGTVFRRELK